MTIAALEDKWALILGASSGFGAATALALAKEGMHIFGVHLDRRATLPNVEKIQTTITDQYKRHAVFFNVNAADEVERSKVITEIIAALKQQSVVQPLKVLLHSLAFGSLRPYIAEERSEEIHSRQMTTTLDVMAHSLVYWVQDLVRMNLLGKSSKIFSLTSAGNHRVWPSYGAVSAAKVALESHSRQLAMELAPKGIAVNCIQAGVTDTPALRKIPDHEAMIQHSQHTNPSGRPTTPDDIAEALVGLSIAESHWLTGNVIVVDGGEDLI